MTQQQWEVVLNRNPSQFSKNGRFAIKKDTSRYPVESVSWDDCQEFMKQMNSGVVDIPPSMGKGKFVLPHEDEWEYACRGGKGNLQPFYFGAKLTFGKEANSKGAYPYTETIGGGSSGPTEVGSYEKISPHPWGLCDMAGNVAQWCENYWDPKSEKKYHVIRGGSWDSWAWECRSANRDYKVGPFGLPNDRSESIGLRVCIRLE